MWMWHFGTWFTGVRLVVGLDDLKGLSQPNRFHSSSPATTSFKPVHLLVLPGLSEMLPPPFV